MKNTILFILFVCLGTVGFSQENKKVKKVETVIIHVSAECGMCKDRIEEKLNYIKGIVYSDVNYQEKKVEVKFKTKQISLDEIKKHISEIGYDADDVKANKTAQSQLPACCQPGGMNK